MTAKHLERKNDRTNLRVATSLSSEYTELESRELSSPLNALLADVYTLYFKTKNFHWHVGGVHFMEFHSMFDEQASQLFAMTDSIAERVRKVGGTTIRSLSQIMTIQRIKDNDAEYVTPQDMLTELLNDNRILVKSLREVHAVSSEYSDFGSCSMIEVWIDETERRIWFLRESTKHLGVDA